MRQVKQFYKSRNSSRMSLCAEAVVAGGNCADCRQKISLLCRIFAKKGSMAQ